MLGKARKKHVQQLNATSKGREVMTFINFDIVAGCFEPLFLPALPRKTGSWKVAGQNEECGKKHYIRLTVYMTQEPRALIYPNISKDANGRPRCSESWLCHWLQTSQRNEVKAYLPPQGFTKEWDGAMNNALTWKSLGKFEQGLVETCGLGMPQA